MESQSLPARYESRTNIRDIFVEWLYVRKEFIIPFLVLFVIIDPLLTFIGTDAFNLLEGNFIVQTLVESQNGWMIWLVLKIIFGLVGTMFMFSAYYMINTGKLSDKEKKKATMFEYSAWSFLIFFLFIVILHWASIIIAG